MAEASYPPSVRGNELSTPCLFLQTQSLQVNRALKEGSHPPSVGENELSAPCLLLQIQSSQVSYISPGRRLAILEPILVCNIVAG